MENKNNQEWKSFLKKAVININKTKENVSKNEYLGDKNIA